MAHLLLACRHRQTPRGHRGDHTTGILDPEAPDDKRLSGGWSSEASGDALELELGQAGAILSAVAATSSVERSAEAVTGRTTTRWVPSP